MHWLLLLGGIYSPTTGLSSLQRSRVHNIVDIVDLSTLLKNIDIDMVIFEYVDIEKDN